MRTPLFTVLTPTYNRAHTLPRVYHSLLLQTYRDFEWLIVDDGSTDSTAELVKQWHNEAFFPIRYIHQENKGKHVASNLGVREARGTLLLFLDSDDACVPVALERFKFHWDSIPESERNGFSTISALCIDAEGHLIGDEYPAEVVDAGSVWRQMRLRSSGDRWGVNRLDVLRRFPFPEMPGETFIPEGIVWNRLSQTFRTRFVNERLRVYTYSNDGLSASSVKNRADSPLGTRLYYMELAAYAIPITQKAKAIINYIRFSFHARIPLRRIVRESTAPCLTTLLCLPGYLLRKLDGRSQ